MHLLRRLRSIWHPDEYHGWGLKRHYFEGWYYKNVSVDEQHALAIIPGISMAHNGEQHAFVQVMDGKANTSTYHWFDAADFRPSEKAFELRILARQAPGTSLISPISGEMTGKAQESLQATLTVELLEKNKRIFEGTGRNAGLEVAGEGHGGHLDVLC